MVVQKPRKLLTKIEVIRLFIYSGSRYKNRLNHISYNFYARIDPYFHISLKQVCHLNFHTFGWHTWFEDLNLKNSITMNKFFEILEFKMLFAML